MYPPVTHRAIAWWLIACCALVYAMVVIGGLTRLTGSGLSIVAWDPIMGAIPPRSDAEWQAAFDAYRQFPEYQQKNLGMTLAGFKGIFLLEYLHRLLGRLIGIAFLLPFLYFLLRGRLNRALAPRLALMFVLGGLQGLMGWYMVKSGLVDRPQVSQYRLTAHLALAFAVYAWMLWVALGLLQPRREAPPAPGPHRLAHLALISVAVTVLSGGFVAGLDAGLAYNTFPTMNGEWIPSAWATFEPWWRNPFENIAAVQFDHRLLALLTLGLILTLYFKARSQALEPRARRGLYLLTAMACLQVGLGIGTLLLQVPIALASLHQAGALMLFTLALYTLHALKTQRPEA